MKTDRRDAESAEEAQGEILTARRDEIQRVGTIVVKGAIAVHRALGPGLLESAYQACLAREIALEGMQVECEVPLPLVYRGLPVNAGYRLDMRVAGLVVVENKVVEEVLPIHKAQLLTYLRLSGCRRGYVLNWNVVMMKHGITRLVNKL